MSCASYPLCARRRRRHRGMSVAELVIAMAIAITAITASVQLMYLSVKQYQKAVDHYLMAVEASNIMEDLMSRPWSELTARQPPAIELSPACLQAVPDAQLTLAIQSVDGEQDVRRISVTIGCSAPSGNPARPIQLTAWRYKM